MARRNNSILIDMLDILSHFPWWVSCIVSAIVYIIMRYLIPYILLEYNVPADEPNIHDALNHGLYKGFASASSLLAPFIALALLIAAPISFINSRRKKQLVEKQKNLNTLYSLQWDEFEELVGDVFRRQGYFVKENSNKGQPDGGIDLVLKKDAEITLVQCKHWKARQVGVRVVRELYGVMASENADRGILITSGLFTPDAKAFAANKPIEMIDGKQLFTLIKTVQKNRTISVQKERTISDTSFHSKISCEICPKCGSEMVFRTAKKGINAGKQFWGCSKFPKCRGTKSYQT